MRCCVTSRAPPVPCSSTPRGPVRRSAWMRRGTARWDDGGAASCVSRPRTRDGAWGGPCGYTMRVHAMEHLLRRKKCVFFRNLDMMSPLNADISGTWRQDLSCSWALEPTVLGGSAATTTEWQQLYAVAQKGDTGRSDRITPMRTKMAYQPIISKHFKGHFLRHPGSSSQMLMVLHAPLPSSHVLRAANTALCSR